MRSFAGFTILLVIVIIIAIFVLPAFAQGTQPITIVTDQPWWSYLIEPLALLVLFLIGAAGTWLTPKLAALIGQQKANALQVAFQSAAERAAGAAFLKVFGRPLSAGLLDTMTPVDMKQAVDVGVSYLKQTMPDTIAKLGADEETLRQAVEANLGLKIAAK